MVLVIRGKKINKKMNENEAEMKQTANAKIWYVTYEVHDSMFYNFMPAFELD